MWEPSETTKLAYVRDLEYFSPSSYKKYREDPIGFYVDRLGPKENRPPREMPEMPQAVGLIFDECIKSMIEVRDPVYQDRALAVEGALDRGVALAGTYTICGAYETLLGESGLGPCEVEREGHVPGTEVPIKGYIDKVSQSAWIERPFAHDWKVTGAGTPERSRSPNKGYLRHYKGGALTQKVHKLAGEPLEELNPDWALQMAFYNWLLGWGLERMPYSLDQCTFDKGVVRITAYRGWILADFVKKLAEDILGAWTEIKEEKVVPPGLTSPDFLRLMS